MIDRILFGNSTPTVWERTSLVGTVFIDLIQLLEVFIFVIKVGVILNIRNDFNFRENLSTLPLHAFDLSAALSDFKLDAALHAGDAKHVSAVLYLHHLHLIQLVIANFTLITLFFQSFFRFPYHRVLHCLHLEFDTVWRI